MEIEAVFNTFPADKTGRIVAASLDGTCAVLSASTGQVFWSVRLAKPVFSSPVWLDGESCAVASVDGLVHCLTDGRTVWAFQAAGPIFSSLTLAAGHRILLGCHDHCIYCLDGQTGGQLWRTELTSPVYASPFISRTSDLVVVVDTKGSLRFLKLADGSSDEPWSLPELGGEVFSSPAVSADGRWLVLGCRNDLLHGFSMRVADKDL